MSDINPEDPRMIARSADMQTSVDAAEKVNQTQWLTAVHDIIVDAALAGATQKDIEAVLGAENNSRITPRFAQLRRAGLIFWNGERRDGCSVWMDSALSIFWDSIAPDHAVEAVAAQEKKLLDKNTRQCPCCHEKLLIVGNQLAKL